MTRGPQAADPCRPVRAVRRRAQRLPRLAAALLMFAIAPLSSLAEPAAEGGADPSLETFLEGMAATRGVAADFREVKRIGLLSEPLEVRGRLWFVPPDRFARITTEPARTRLVIDGERFLFRDAAGQERMDLGANPVAREFVENFVVLFGGDPEALRARYEPALHLAPPRERAEGSAASAEAGAARAWRLELRPRRRPLTELIERVTLAGRGRRLERLEVRETDGDRTTTWLEDVEVDRRFDAAELERIFRMPEEGGREPGEGADAS